MYTFYLLSASLLPQHQNNSDNTVLYRIFYFKENFIAQLLCNLQSTINPHSSFFSDTANLAKVSFEVATYKVLRIFYISVTNGEYFSP